MGALRLDRLATLYIAKPLLAVANCAFRRIPILMYHSISDSNESEVAPYYRTCTSPAMFEQQMSFLARNAYDTISLADAHTRLESSNSLEKAVVITFDDAFHDFYSEAFPVLKRHGQTATMFVPTAYISESRGSFKNRECLTWNEIRELRKAGMTFGSHTVTHPKLVELPANAVKSELRDSKARLEDELSEQVDAFAYPYAFPQAAAEFTKSFRAALEDEGYRFCVTTEIGTVGKADDPLRWKRLPANSDDDFSLFGAKLRGAYDWLSLAQSAFKRAKAVIKPA